MFAKSQLFNLGCLKSLYDFSEIIADCFHFQKVKTTGTKFLLKMFSLNIGFETEILFWIKHNQEDGQSVPQKRGGLSFWDTQTSRTLDCHWLFKDTRVNCFTSSISVSSSLKSVKQTTLGLNSFYILPTFCWRSKIKDGRNHDLERCWCSPNIWQGHSGFKIVINEDYYGIWLMKFFSFYAWEFNLQLAVQFCFLG